MTCTEAYKEHIMYTFHGFCKVVIRNAAITAWRDQSRRYKREISLEYLTEEKFYPLGRVIKSNTDLDFENRVINVDHQLLRSAIAADGFTTSFTTIGRENLKGFESI